MHGFEESHFGTLYMRVGDRLRVVKGVVKGLAGAPENVWEASGVELGRTSYRIRATILLRRPPNLGHARPNASPY